MQQDAKQQMDSYEKTISFIDGLLALDKSQILRNMRIGNKVIDKELIYNNNNNINN